MRLHSPIIHFFILAAVCLPYCINLGASSIWDANEAFYAETPREMLASGDYVAPRFNFAPRTQKPPLTYWAVLVSYRIFGVNEFAVRLPSALAAIGVILFSYAIARLLFSSRAALMAAIVTSTTARLFILARRLPIDILLLFFLTGTLFFLLWAIKSGKRHIWVFVYLFAALGFMTKGPIALFLPGVSYLLWSLWARRFGAHAVYPFMGAAIFILVSLPWYAIVYRDHGLTYIAPFFLRDNLGRFTSEALGPSRGVFYYFPVALTDFFPWSILALCAFILLWLRRKPEQPLKSLEYGLPLFWCVCTFILFSLSKNKQEYYIAPIYPIVGIIVSAVLDKTVFCRSAAVMLPGPGVASHPKAPSDPMPAEQSQPRGWFWVFAFMALFMFLLALLSPYVLHAFMPNIPLLVHYAPSAVFLAGTLLLALHLVRRKLVHCFVALAIPLWIVYMVSATVYLPALERYRPVKRFCRLIEIRSESEDAAGYFRTALPSMAFYLQRPIFEEYDFEGMARRLQSDKRVFCILTERDYGYFADSRDLKIHILDRNAHFSIRFGALMNAGYFPEEELLLISNRADSQSRSIEDNSK